MWSTPSSRNVQVVARSAVAGGIGNWVMAAMREVGKGMTKRGGGGGRRKSRAATVIVSNRHPPFALLVFLTPSSNKYRHFFASLH